MSDSCNWNNKRHNKVYWISIFMLLFVALNITEWFSAEEYPFVVAMRNFVYGIISYVIPSFVKRDVDYILLTLFTFYFLILLVIWIVNYLCGFLPNLKISERGLKYGYILKSVVIEDIVVGGILELCALGGLIEIVKFCKITSIATWVYILIFLYGIYSYWKSTIGINRIRIADRDFQFENEYEKIIWYCTANCKERISTFARAPWKGEIKCFFVDEKDTDHRECISVDDFLYYLIVIECDQHCTKKFEEQVKKILSLPHANVLTLIFGDSEKYRYIVDDLEKQKNVTVVRYPEIMRCNHLDMEMIVTSMEYKNPNIKGHPRRFLNNSILLKTYSGIGNGPQICLDFLKTIMNSLEILPSIYALFDYIDLQYRIQIAFTLEPDCQKQYTWMRNKGRIIGNINIMANIIEESVIKKRIEYNDNELSVQDFFDCIIEEKDLELIKKYLPNYERDDCRPIQDTIIYLTTSLRNVLRGHGTFEKEDAYNLYIIIFKLALLNIYLVGTNETVITIDNNPVWMSQDYMYYGVLGSTKFTSSKLLSPFLVSSANENILVFNNWNKEGLTELEQIEYINYLEGTLILPEYKSVNIIN